MATGLSRHSLTPADARLVDEVCNRFEGAWKAGATPRIEEYLAEANRAVHSWLLEELLLLDCHYRASQGQTPSPDDYISRLPADSATIHRVFDRAKWVADRTSTKRRFDAATDHTTVELGDSSADVAELVETLTTERQPGNDETRYQLLEEIGVGGIGRVYRARDRHLRRELAVKVLRASHEARLDIIQRFIAEAQIGAQLQHTGIAPVYEMGYFANGSPFLAMKLVRGHTLASMLSNRRTASENQAGLLAIFQQVCQAIAYAHARGVIHRDLKPGNIMVGEFGEVQVMDWGLAKVLGARESAEQEESPEGEAHTIRTQRTETDEFVSRAGLIIGTPAYMPPEQSLGAIQEIDQRSDVFALGAILCEILTLRPPFAADSTDEVCRMSQTGDLAEAHQRLNGCGADSSLRELAIACLAAEPADRPADAGVVAQELANYLASVEDRIQQERLNAERQKLLALEERKQRKLWIGLSAVALFALSMAAIAGLIWQHNQSQSRQRLMLAAQQVEADLLQAKNRIAAGDIRAAWLDWNRAAAREGLEALPELCDERDRLRRDLELTDELDRIRLLRSANKYGVGIDLDAPLAEYEKAFARYGLNVWTENQRSLAERMKKSLVKSALFASVHDWMLVCEYQFRREADETRRQQWRNQRNRLLELARLVNSDAKLDPIYDPANWDSPGKLDEFSKQLNTADVSPHLLVTLGEMLSDEARETLWRSGQSNHPGDFWINSALAMLLDNNSNEEAVGFYRAALAIRPDAVTVHNSFGACLKSLNRLDEAFASYQRAIKIDPDYWLAYVNIGNIWRDRGDLDAAIESYRHSLRLHPDGRSWTNLAQALYLKGNLDEAIQAVREALLLEPDLAEPHKNLGMFLEAAGKIDEALVSYHKAWELDPEVESLRQNLSMLHYDLANDFKDHQDFSSAIHHYRRSIEVQPMYVSAHLELADIFKRTGDLPAAIVSYRDAVRLEPNAADVHFKLGWALLAHQDYAAAQTSFRQAIELNPDDPQAHRNLGVTLSKLGRHEEAIGHINEALKRDPDYAEAYISLGLTLWELGRLRESLECLQKGRDLGVKSESGRQAAEQGIKDVSRLVELEGRWPAILAGEVQPTSVTEALEFASLCFVKKHYSASAQRFSDAFERFATAIEPLSDYRQQAIYAAALAAGGRSAEPENLDEGTKRRWRSQSLGWLRDALAGCTNELNRDPDGSTHLAKIRDLLQKWQQRPELSVVREAGELAKLSADEQAAWTDFWRDVQHLSDQLKVRR
jgi:serine/threonine-protein kinase